MLRYTRPSGSSASAHSSMYAKTLADSEYVRPLSSENQTWVELYTPQCPQKTRRPLCSDVCFSWMAVAGPTSEPAHGPRNREISTGLLQDCPSSADSICQLVSAGLHVCACALRFRNPRTNWRMIFPLSSSYTGTGLPPMSMSGRVGSVLWSETAQPYSLHVRPPSVDRRMAMPLITQSEHDGMILFEFGTLAPIRASAKATRARGVCTMVTTR
mmetsp:Transcript_11290/g.33917  ORF Transcript_11290/g.33917 Transcript_11290/m.33917 type:complete len:214 (+) Transcript_11290:438-1079(+)